MTEADWLRCQDPAPMVGHLRHAGLATPRKMQLFAVAVCRRTWPMLSDSLRQVVETGERAADDANYQTEAKALRAWLCPGPAFTGGKPEAAAYAAVSVPYPPVWGLEAAADLVCADAMRRAVAQGRTRLPVDAKGRERAIQAELLRDIFGNPFRPVTLQPPCLTEDVLHLASTIYELRSFERAPELAAVLKAAGCDDAAVLDHLATPGEHVRGCWAVDLALGRA